MDVTCLGETVQALWEASCRSSQPTLEEALTSGSFSRGKNQGGVRVRGRPVGSVLARPHIAAQRR